MKRTPKEIIEILHSIKKVSVKDGSLDVWQNEAKFPATIQSFDPEAFTHQLLSLIENYLLG